jgi:hypothetical protein
MSIEIKLAADGSGAELQLAGGHSVNVPLDHRTGGIIARILHAQAQAERQGSRVGPGHSAAPLQSMIDDYVRRGGVVTRIEPKVPASERPKVAINLGDLFPDLV